MRSLWLAKLTTLVGNDLGPAMKVVYLACICHFSFFGDEGLDRMGTVHTYIEIIDLCFSTPLLRKNSCLWPLVSCQFQHAHGPLT